MRKYSFKMHEASLLHYLISIGSCLDALDNIETTKAVWHYWASAHRPDLS